MNMTMAEVRKLDRKETPARKPPAHAQRITPRGANGRFKAPPPAAPSSGHKRAS